MSQRKQVLHTNEEQQWHLVDEVVIWGRACQQKHLEKGWDDSTGCESCCQFAPEPSADWACLTQTTCPLLGPPQKHWSRKRTQLYYLPPWHAMSSSGEQKWVKRLETQDTNSPVSKRGGTRDIPMDESMDHFCMSENWRNWAFKSGQGKAHRTFVFKISKKRGSQMFCWFLLDLSVTMWQVLPDRKSVV